MGTIIRGIICINTNYDKVILECVQFKQLSLDGDIFCCYVRPGSPEKFGCPIDMKMGTYGVYMCALVRFLSPYLYIQLSAIITHNAIELKKLPNSIHEDPEKCQKRFLTQSQH